MSVQQSVLFATTNKHKLVEVASILSRLNLRVCGLDSQGSNIPEPIEDGKTFAANAVLKAKYYASQTGQLALADDSGLVVDALEGQPGVHSARYSGSVGLREFVDRQNNIKLIEALKGVSQNKRTARFVCVMALCSAEQTWIVTRGTVEGCIALEEKGTNGFGYDPLFYLPRKQCTTAELPPEEKNRISHRGQATRLLAALLPKLQRDRLF